MSARPSLARDLGQILLSSRPVSWINTAFPFAAAYITITREIDLVAIVGTLFFLIPYNLAMYGINDVFDYESDLRNPRKGGAHGAILDRRLHRITLVTAVAMCMPFVIFLWMVGSWPSRGVLLVSLFFVVAYSAPPFRWKEVPLLDSFTSAVHFVSPAVFAITLAGARWDQPLILAMGAFLLWGIASHAFGAVQDITADREAGLASIGTAFGAARTARFAFACYLAAAIAVLFLPWPSPLLVIAAVPYLFTVAPYLRLRDEDCERATAGWRKFLWLNQFAGFVVTMLLIWWWFDA